MVLQCFLCQSTASWSEKADTDNLVQALLDLTKYNFLEDLANGEQKLLREIFSDALNKLDICFCETCKDDLCEIKSAISRLKDVLIKLSVKISNILKSYEQLKRTPDDEGAASNIKSEEYEDDCKQTYIVSLDSASYDVLSSSSTAEDDKKETLQNILKNIFPKCNISFNSNDSIVCATENCPLKLTASLSSESESCQMILSVYGEPSHVDEEEPSEKDVETSTGALSEKKICEYCCKTFKDDQEIEEQDNEYSCLKCNAVFKTVKQRNFHHLCKHTKDPPYTCLRCSKKFKTSVKGLKQEQANAKGKSSVCQECGKSFSSSRGLETHFDIVHAKVESKWSFKCPECPKKFYKRDNLRSHLLTHESEKSWQCDVQGCEKKFKRRKALTIHQEKVHGGKKETHLCPVCGKNFASVSGIKSHMAKHTGKEYVKRNAICPTCGKKFRCPADLKTHLVVHTKEKPHPCTMCSLSFTQRSSLNDHLNVHWNTFQCHRCKKSFGRQRYLDKHLRHCPKVGKEAKVEGDTDIKNESIIVSRQDDNTTVLSCQEVECVIIDQSQVLW